PAGLEARGDTADRGLCVCGTALAAANGRGASRMPVSHHGEHATDTRAAAADRRLDPRRRLPACGGGSTRHLAADLHTLAPSRTRPRWRPWAKTPRTKTIPTSRSPRQA